MAAVSSLGVHTPTALPYLVTEGLLPPDRNHDQYQWDTYIVEDGADCVEEELLVTQNAVAWSQGRLVRNVYRFDLEGEAVVQAILTRFPATSSTQSKAFTSSSNGVRPLRHSLGSSDFQRQQHIDSAPIGRHASRRAIVVLLKTKAHIYFLRGAHHILDLPFEVERAFAAPRGVILQRKRTVFSSLPPTPQIPAAPPNSFFSSQGPGPSLLRHSVSPTLVKSFARTSFTHNKPSQPSSLGGNLKLNTLFQDVIATPGKRGDEDVTNVYSLSGPLAELGVVTYSIQHQRSQKSTRSQHALSVEFEGLDPAEQIVYVSAKNELTDSKTDNLGPLTLIVSFNPDINIITIWHAWYVDDTSLKTLLKLRADQKAAKARRRSSFLSANVGTGATTPAVRRRDGARESFAAPNQLVGELAGSQGTALSRNQSRQQQEEAMASQMDPDYQPVGSQQPARENRRISSINADVRASQTTVNASFAAGGGGRRTTSFGGPNTRRSISHRKSRGSTPGSAYGQSNGGDESMDLDSTLEFDSDETTDEILQHIRATFEKSGVDNVFDSSEEGFKRELIVRKIHSFPTGLSASSQGSSGGSSANHKVVTLLEPHHLQTSNEHSLAVYVHDRADGETQYMHFKVKQRPLWPELTHSPHAAIPLLVDQGRLDRCEDILKIHDGKSQALVLGGQGVQLGLNQQTLCPAPYNAPYRLYSPLDVLSTGSDEHKDVGKNRTLDGPLPPIRLQHAGPSARFDETGRDGISHRRKFQLRPLDPHIEKLLAVYEVVLPRQQGEVVRKLWCQSYARLQANIAISQGTSCSAEFIAFVATIFTFAIDMLDDKARAALNISKMASGKGHKQVTPEVQLQKTKHATDLQRSPIWSWLPPQRPTPSRSSPQGAEPRKDQLLIIAASLADELSSLIPQGSVKPIDSANVAVKIMLALHLCHEEQKLCTLSFRGTSNLRLAPVIAQIGLWLGLRHWSYGPGRHYELEGASDERWSYVKSRVRVPPRLEFFEQPISVFQWFEHALKHSSPERYPSFSSIAGMDGASSYGTDVLAQNATPRLSALSELVFATQGVTKSAVTIVEYLAQRGMTIEMLDTYPEAISAPFKDAIARCEKEPPTTWKDELLQLIGREDLSTNAREEMSSPKLQWILYNAARDVGVALHNLEHTGLQLKTKEAGRHAVSQLIFSEDRRLVEAMGLMHFNSVQVAQCPKQPDWDEATHFEHQRKLMHWVTIRMIALPAGDGMIHYDSQTPLLTEKYHLPGFNSSCVMQPMGHTLTTDRSGLTEEKVNWAYFHAGVSAGMRISRNVKGIDTSWIAFNKPSELTNRHAGMLLALGLGGHLRHLAKWLSFKYLTPKHTMTSVGLLLGLSASYLGTMDGLITRMLSVHITRMLPPGAAELNVSPATQTAGLMGIGLLYYNTQHRRMSEIMLSEIEHMEMEDPDSGPDTLRDESYRLAAGFALGLINLGKGNNLQGLHGMYLPERLLAVAVGPRPVHAVHVFDRATAGAVVAVALVYMKTGDRSVANKIDIPDTEAQYDHVRPDILMLRAMAKHIILWDDIQAQGIVNGRPGWIHANLPGFYKNKLVDASNQVTMKNTMNCAHIPLFNVFTGLAWSLGLKYAGSGDVAARDEILGVLKAFYAFGWSESYYFDAKLGRSSLKRCMDALALCAAVVMAGTGDLETFRYLRRMHGRTDADTTYGSHLAAHLAIGVLFLGGGTFSFGTSNLAIASLICAFYPLFPTDVQDNRVHLQAFRHLWVFAAEARCITIEDIDTQRPIHMPIKVTKRDGTEINMRAPCLLPELDTVAAVQTDNPAYWRVTLDFANNPQHLEAFRKDQRVFVRRCPAAEAHSSAFSAALAALNDAQTAMVLNPQIWHTLFNLPAFKDLDRADVELLLPPDINSSVYSDDRATVVDDRMVLSKAVRGNDRDALWNLRMLFAWAERARRQGNGRMSWLGEEVIEGLRAKIEERARYTSA